MISAVPLSSVSPDEPAAEALGTPEDPSLLAANSQPFNFPLAPPPASDIQVIGRKGGIFIPPLFPVFFGSPGSNPGILVTPPTTAPKPDTLLMFSLGVSSLLTLQKKWKR